MLRPGGGYLVPKFYSQILASLVGFLAEVFYEPQPRGRTLRPVTAAACKKTILLRGRFARDRAFLPTITYSFLDFYIFLLLLLYVWPVRMFSHVRIVSLSNRLIMWYFLWYRIFPWNLINKLVFNAYCLPMWKSKEECHIQTGLGKKIVDY